MNSASKRALDEGGRQLAARYLPLVERVAHRLVRRLPTHVDVRDLVSAGVLGLADAVAKFNPEKQTDFETYAEWRIKGAILDELRSIDPLTRDQRRQVSELKQATRELEAELGRAPEEAELAAKLEVDLDELASRREQLEAASAVRFDDVLQVERQAGGASPEALYLEAEASQSVVDALAGLPPRLAEVLRLSYSQELSLKEIGAQLGVTESRVCQLRREAVERLRGRLQAA